MVGTMNDWLVEDRVAEKSVYVVEIMGLAGTGKTTLANFLSQANQKIRVGVNLPKISYIPFYLDTAYLLLPAYLTRNWNGRRFSRGEIRAMVYLMAWLKGFERRKSDTGKINILDHGPIYRLAILREFGPETITSPRLSKWWCRMLNLWATTLDMVIWLDAPDAVLLERIRTRNRWHAIKDLPEHAGYGYLMRFRTAFERTISMLPTKVRPTIFRLDTDQETVSRSANRILTAFSANFNC